MKRTSVFVMPLLTSIWMVLIANGPVHADVMTIENSTAQIDTGEYELIRESNPGGSAYQSRGVILDQPTMIHSLRYQKAPEASGYARVEVLTFPKSERYAAHNVINAALYAVSQLAHENVEVPDSPPEPAGSDAFRDWLIEQQDKMIEYRLSKIEYLKCRLVDHTKAYPVTFVQDDQWPVSGLVAWAAEGGDVVRCVFVRLRNLDGLPIKLLAHLLEEYPSSMPVSMPTANQWTLDEFSKVRACFDSGTDARALKRALGCPLLLRDSTLLGSEFIALRADRNLTENRELTPTEREELRERIVGRIEAAMARYSPENGD